jgi:galactonate dehydratase
MQITGAETFLVGNPWKNWTFLVLETDEGLEGVGEATVHLAAKTVATAIHELARFYVGRDPADIADIWLAVAREVRLGPIHSAALAALEMACYDLRGQVEEVPVAVLLGGDPAGRVPVYANGWYQGPRTPENFAKRARNVVGRGYTTLKFDPFGSAFHDITPAELDRAVEIVAAVREAVGPGGDICIEGHWRFSPDQAVTVAERIEPYRPLWFEEPVPSHDIEGLRWIRERVNVPLATGEHLLEPVEFRRLLETGACDYIQPDILHVGGFRRMIEIGRMAAEEGVHVAPHQSEGPVASVANVQLASMLPGFFIQEMFDDFAVPWRHALLDNPVEIADGHAIIAQRPGLGIRFNREQAARHPYDPDAFQALFEEGWESRKMGGPGEEPRQSDRPRISALSRPSRRRR